MQMAKEKQNLLLVTFEENMDKARFECYLLNSRELRLPGNSSRMEDNKSIFRHYGIISYSKWPLGKASLMRV